MGKQAVYPLRKTLLTLRLLFRLRIIEIQSTFTIDTIGNFDFSAFQSTQFSYPIAFQGGLFIYPPTAGASTAAVTKGPAGVWTFDFTKCFMTL